jgi:hypothetical protein
MAFDSVCHGLLILKLRQCYGFDYSAVALAFGLSYLFPRHQRVGCGGDFFFICA